MSLVSVISRGRDDVELVGPDIHVEYLRSPRYALRLIAGLVLLTAGTVSVTAGANLVTGLWLGVRTTVAQWPSWVTGIPAGFVVTAGLLVPVAVIAINAALGRFRDLATIVATGLLAALADALLSRAVTPHVLGNVDPALLNLDPQTVGHLSQAATTGLIAVLVLVGPWAPRWMLRIGWTLVALDLGLRLANALEPPLLMTLLCGLGVTIGALIGLLVGLREVGPQPADVVDALRRTGVEPKRLIVPTAPTADWLITDADGRSLRTRITGPDRWAGEVLLRSGRLAVLKNVGERSPFTSMRSLAEREALVAMRAVDGGVNTPDVASIAQIGDNMLLTFDEIDGGRKLSELTTEEFTDDVLDAAWHEVTLLHLIGIAHRNLDLDHLVLDRDGRAWIVGLDRAVLDPHDGVIAGDVATLLAVTAAVVGIDRGVEHALRAVGRARLADALPRLQATGMPRGMAKPMRRHKMLAPLREATRAASGADELVTTELRRVTPRGVISVLMGAAAVYFLVPQILDSGDLWSKVTDAHWAWLLAAIVTSTISYIGAGLTIAGSVPDPVPIGPATAAAVATSFSNSLAPAGIGGLALGTRFLQKVGVDLSVAVSGMGIKTVIGLVIHIVTMVAVLLSLGRTDVLDDVSISWETAAIAALVVLVPAAIALALPWGRRPITQTLWPEVLAAGRGVLDVARNPAKLAALGGGSMIITVAYGACLVVSVRAFGGTTPTISILLVYLSASVVASAAPTPGGLGAAEAAFVGGLRAAGEDAGIAIAAVFLYRFATFWLPIFPGWLSMKALERRGLL